MQPRGILQAMCDSEINLPYRKLLCPLVWNGAQHGAGKAPQPTSPKAGFFFVTLQPLGLGGVFSPAA
jgi:hypothetical protein